MRKIVRQILTKKTRQKLYWKKCEWNNWAKWEQNNWKKSRKTIYIKAYLGNLIQETNLPTTPLGKSITRNMMKGAADQVSLPNEIGGSVKFLVFISNPFRNQTANFTDPTIQPSIFTTKKRLDWDTAIWYDFPLGSLGSGTDVPIYQWSIDNRTGVNLQGPIVTMIPESNSTSRCQIFDSVRG